MRYISIYCLFPYIYLTYLYYICHIDSYTNYISHDFHITYIFYLLILQPSYYITCFLYYKYHIFLVSIPSIDILYIIQFHICSKFGEYIISYKKYHLCISYHRNWKYCTRKLGALRSPPSSSWGCLKSPWSPIRDLPPWLSSPLDPLRDLWLLLLAAWAPQYIS